MPVKKDDFARAAIRKGFCEKRSGHHIYYRYETPGGRLSPYIHTHISHGGGNALSDALLSEMTHQMKFDKKADLMAFIDCTFSKEKYLVHLKTKGLIE
ncbi:MULTISPECIES: hypothetical protein [Methanocorpusculum]|jgi:hypothetical protein|uniref:hypothetical protein n=1 Tax=Methanocorpusculum TaxID=2192 RepID=UPI0005B2E74F|nr:MULTISPECIES: hypothetical protein [Methanocorpusculum]MCK9323846.1 hypothetical protein [Candidatus Methanomethylophilaceae archaeon]MEA5086959.1 hypothetical protein [Methanocorpusculum sp.]NCB45014.1 hypothetical protein [Clostridia bacterium]NLC90719.1 hypothetical protein [Methanocorpusculum parvum]